MRRLIQLIPACAHVPGLVLAPALPRASHPPFCSHPKAHPKVPSHPDEVVTRRAGVFSLGTFPYTFCWFKPSLQCQPHRWGVTGQRVPGIKHGICVLWGNEGSLWAAPGAPEVWFHAPFVPSPIPVLPTHPPASLACGGDDAAQAGEQAARPAAPHAPATGSGPRQARQSLGGHSGGWWTSLDPLHHSHPSMPT